MDTSSHLNDCANPIGTSSYLAYFLTSPNLNILKIVNKPFCSISQNKGKTSKLFPENINTSKANDGFTFLNLQYQFSVKSF